MAAAEAEATEVFAAADRAEMMAYFLLGVRRDHPDLVDRLPSADEVVRACLHAVPVAVEQVALLDDDRNLHGRDLTQMRQSRQAKNLVNAAQRHRDHVRDEHLADQLRRWIAVKPRLVKPATVRRIGVDGGLTGVVRPGPARVAVDQPGRRFAVADGERVVVVHLS